MLQTQILRAPGAALRFPVFAVRIGNPLPRSRCRPGADVSRGIPLSARLSHPVARCMHSHEISSPESGCQGSLLLTTRSARCCRGRDWESPPGQPLRAGAAAGGSFLGDKQPKPSLFPAQRWERVRSGCRARCGAGTEGPDPPITVGCPRRGRGPRAGGGSRGAGPGRALGGSGGAGAAACEAAPVSAARRARASPESPTRQPGLPRWPLLGRCRSAGGDPRRGRLSA